ncbi:hypothetical protein [Actinomadura sp. 3N508]|uniref:hypothetical protein n=1 Tax=Actinomadura sp. 3N508 TaxID=3375153 RepID=UPI00378A263E
MTGALIVAVLGIGGAGTATVASATGGEPTRQDCRTYSGVTQCGEPQLNEKQRACVTTAVQQGMTERRAEVECRAFG